MLTRSAFFVIFICLASAQVFAAGFEVRPVLVETTNGVGSLTVSNPGANRLYLQGTLFRLSYNAAGVEELTTVPDLIVSPPATWIEPQSEYRFRIKVPKAASGEELSYRLLLAEVPTREVLVNGGVVMTVVQSIPVFSQGKSIKPASLSATLVGSNLLIHNNGGRHARIAELMQDGKVIKNGLLGYALSGSTLAVHLTTPIHPGRIDFTTDLGPQTIIVTK